MRAPVDHAIEPALSTHAPTMAAIHRAAFPADEAWSRDVMSLQLDLPACFGFIAGSGGMVLGRVMADESEIVTLAVIPAMRRLGLGGTLLRAAMTHAAAAGARKMFLEVAVTNDPAHSLYRAHGFVEAGVRRRYYADGTDALVLRSTLGAGAVPSPCPSAV